MGFGILIAGYYTTYLIGMLMVSEIYGALIVLFGYLVMASALLRLSEYHDGFRSALFFDGFIALFALYRVLYCLSDMLLWQSGIFSEGVRYYAELVEILLFLCLHVTLLLAVRGLAASVELPKVVFSSVRNLVVLGIYTVLSIMVRLPAETVGEWVKYLAGPTALLQIAFYILMAVLLTTCYMRISDESDVDMPLRPSRFKWLNRFREETARREQAAADSTREYAEQRLRERQRAREEYNKQRRKEKAKKKRR
jgi:hypothetical protein